MKKLFLIFALVLTAGMNAWAQDADYLCFTAEEDEAYFQLYKYGTPTNVTLEYSTNGGSSWTDYTFTAAEVSTYGPVIWLQNAGDKVYFRNKSNSVTNFSTSAENYYRFSIHNNKISVSGNVMSLVDKRCATTTIPNNYCFARLFDYCPSITSAPKLPATELKEGCYYRMFTGCNNLTNAPTLPARTLKSYCYYEMFEGCTSLSHVEVGFAEWVPSGTTDALRWWMQDVSQTGTFECPKDLDTSSRSNYIPDGWTISQYMPDYLCFTTEKAASICLEKQGSPTEVTIEYSKDGMKWNTLTLYEYVELQSGETLYLRNASETVTEFSKGGRDYYHFRLSSSGRISASGNIMSLVDKSCNTKTIPCNYCFYELFSGNRNLTSAPKLPATTLAIECYENMFKDCTGLTEAPALPATSLSHACYSNMFSGCTGLVNAPELATTTLAEGCYRSMFQGCTGLTVAPELPATTLVRGCYENMFGHCTGLTEAPELPAPTLVEKCYYGMFDNCSNLRKVSVYFKEWLLADQYGATTGWLDDVAEEGEFICPPGLPNIVDRSHIPENWTVKHPYLCFTANTTSSSRVSLSKVGSPADVALEYSKDASVWQPYTFGTEISLSPGASVYFRNPSRTPTGFSAGSANYYHFSVEGDVAASGNIMTLVEKTGSITEMPYDYLGLFYGLFSGCTGLTAAPELPATKLASKCYMEIFSGCSNLVSAPELPATTLANYCYYGMFSGCTSLTSAPELPATILANNCYREMFKDCSSLNFIKVGFTKWHENATRDWLSGVAAKGVFEAPVELDKTKTGTSNIPTGWTQAIFHPRTEPTFRTVGYSQDCWEVPGTGKYYSDNLCTQELNAFQTFRYAKFLHNPICSKNEFVVKETTSYNNIPFNWAAETSFYQNPDIERQSRNVEFIVCGNDVADARMKWWLSGWGMTDYDFKIYVNGNEKYSYTYSHYGAGTYEEMFEYHLNNLRAGDKISFEVNFEYDFRTGGGGTVATCLEYTCNNEGERGLIHHDVVEPTYTTRGFTQECLEDYELQKFYTDASYSQELNPAQIVTYEKLISNPVTANPGFTIKEDSTYEGVQFNWAVVAPFKGIKYETPKTIEFTAYGTDVDNARIKWAKNYGNVHYGNMVISIYVNDKLVYSINQNDGKTLEGTFSVPLPGLKQGDVVKFVAERNFYSPKWAEDPTIIVCLEYNSSNGGEREYIHHDVAEPTYTTRGFTQECWEEVLACKFYSDANYTQELNPAQVVTYKKTISNPIKANTGFTLKEDATYDGVQFNWAAETVYEQSQTGTRFVEFKVNGTDIANARLKWTKDHGSAEYGKFTIVVYVNGKQVYSVNQDDGKSLEGLFAVPLRELKDGDVVKFEVSKKNASDLNDSPMIAACLEYTSSNEGKINVTVKAVDKQKIIGNADPALTYTTYPANIELSGINLTRDEGEEAGEYVIRISEDEGANSDYDITFAEGKFTISKSPITITADDKTKLAGDADPELTWSVKGKLIEGHDLTDIIIISREKGEEAGAYSIYASQANGANPYYDITFVDGTLVIADTDLPIYHGAAEPTYRTLGYTQNCWEDPTTGKIYSDVLFENELDQTKVITYSGLISNPIKAYNGFTHKNAATYYGVKYNWVAETTFDPKSLNDTRSVEFMVLDKEVDNVRIKWAKNLGNCNYGSFAITVYVNGKNVYSINQGNTNLEGTFALPLPGLKTGDVVRFQVYKQYVTSWDGSPTIAACLEYTSSNGGAGVILTADDKLKNKGDDDPELTWQITGGSLAEGDKLTGIKIWREKGEEIGSYTIHVSQEEGTNPKYNITFVEGTFRISDIIHHDVTEPTYETVGFLQECWEDRTLGKYYSDAACTKELSPAQVVTYAKIISDPVTANNSFTLKDVTYSGIQFDWAAETTYGEWDTDTRSVEFTVYGTDVDNARLKWRKTYSDARYGIFNITVYVNGKQVYRIQNYGGADLFAVPLQGLKTGDIVRFEVQMTDRTWAGSPTITACLEYTSSNGGLNGMLITANQDPDHKQNYYSTFWSSTAAYQVPEGVTAYTGKVEDSTSEPNTSVLKLTAIEDGIIPASQGVILRLTTEDNGEGKKQIALVKTMATGTWSGTNALMGTDVATTLGANEYALSLGQNGVGFYLWEGKSIGAHKAYLTLPSSFGAKAFIFQFDDDPTGIESLTPALSEGEGAAYNLNGVRVDDNYKGIVIKNGKKIYQK